MGCCTIEYKPHGRIEYRLEPLYAEVLGHSGPVEVVNEWGRRGQARCVIQWREHDGLERRDCVYSSALRERFIRTCKICGRDSHHSICPDHFMPTPSTSQPARVVLKDQVVTSS